MGSAGGDAQGDLDSEVESNFMGSLDSVNGGYGTATNSAKARGTNGALANSAVSLTIQDLLAGMRSRVYS